MWVFFLDCISFASLASLVNSVISRGLWVHSLFSICKPDKMFNSLICASLVNPATVETL